jgi:hypothetical protein
MFEKLLDLLPSCLEVGRGAASGEVFGKDWLKKAMEDDLSTARRI